MSEIENASKPIIQKLIAPVGVSDIAVNEENGPALLPFPALTDTERSQLALWKYCRTQDRRGASAAFIRQALLAHTRLLRMAITANSNWTLSL